MPFLILLFLALVNPHLSQAGNCPNLLGKVAKYPLRLLPYLQEQGGKTWHFQNKKTLGKKTLSFAVDVTNLSIKTALPGILDQLGTKTTPIHRRQWRKPDYEPSPNERKILEEAKEWESFQKRGQWLQEHRNWVSYFRRPLSDSFGLAMKASSLFLINFLSHFFGDDNNKSDREYAENPQLGPSDDEVQILIETVPFPHVAIRIGGSVYTYGYTHMKAVPSSQYIYAEDLNEIFPDKDEDPGKIAKSFNFIAEKIGWKSGPRSVQVITLRVGQEKRNQIKRQLEEQTLKRYDNLYFVNNCSTMALRSLNRDLQLVDPSPSAVGAYFTARRTLGDKQVGKVFLVTREGNENSASILARNALVNIQDIALNLTVSPYAQSRRFILEQNTQKEAWARHEPEVVELIESWREIADEEIANDVRIELFNSLSLSSTVEKVEQEKLQTQINDYLNQKVAQAKAETDNPEAPFRIFSLAVHKKARYEEIREEFLKRLKN